VSESLEPIEGEERARLMTAGREAFNRGEFFEAHELWEEVWNVIDEPERSWVQGLIQVATGLHKLDRGRKDVCATLLRKALPKLVGAPAILDGVDVAAARAGAERVLAAIGRGELPAARSVRV
jgi:predicted metal-dependent hydrolase